MALTMRVSLPIATVELDVPVGMLPIGIVAGNWALGNLVVPSSSATPLATPLAVIGI